MKRAGICAIGMIVFIIAGCSTDNENDERIFSGSSQDVEDFFSREVLDGLNLLQFTINEGDTPPNLEGNFFASPMIIADTNVPEDVIGTRLVDFFFEFSDQDNTNNTLDFNGESRGFLLNDLREIFFGDGSSFISGSNNDFSVFSVIVGQDAVTDAMFDFAYVISGTVTTDGIADLELAVLMLDDRGDPFERLIENGQGRRIVDEDGLSVTVEMDTSNQSPSLLRTASGLLSNAN